MAAIDADTQEVSAHHGYGQGIAESQDAGVQGYLGRKHLIFKFVTQVIANGDTWDPPIGPTAAIVSAAWESESDKAYLVVTNATTITFTADSTSEGYAHIWVSG